MPPPHPPWYKQNDSKLVSVVTLRALILRHAADFNEAALFLKAIEQEVRQCELLRFEEIADDDDYHIDSSDDDSVSSTALFEAHLNSGWGRVFRTPRLRPNQKLVIIAH